MRLKLYLIFALFLHLSTFSQVENPEKAIYFEPFFNMSNALSRATGNNITSHFNADPNAIGLRFLSQKMPFDIRLGTNFLVNFNNDFSTGRITEESIFSMGIGLEFRKDIFDKFQYYYGIDFRYFYHTDQVSNFDPIERLTNTIRTTSEGPGVAPFFGIRWMINDRFSLLTEGYFRVEYLYSERFFSNENTSSYETLGYKFRLNPIPPGAITAAFRL